MEGMEMGELTKSDYGRLERIIQKEIDSKFKFVETINNERVKEVVRKEIQELILLKSKISLKNR
jgi:hypothetical protein